METSKTQIAQSNWLIFLGLLLFFIGLVIGLFVQNMVNPRMALSAHLEGLMNGMFLAILGIVWHRISITTRLLKLTFWLALYGSFANVIAVFLGGLTGAGRLMPLAGGLEGDQPIEGIISFQLTTLALSMLAVLVLVMVGFYKHMFAKTIH